MKEEFDFENIKNKAIEQLKAGKPLLGKDGAFAPLLESILNATLEDEMDAHLTEEERQMGNRRNGKMQKQVQTPLGEVTVSTPRDRNSSFDPQFIIDTNCLFRIFLPLQALLETKQITVSRYLSLVMAVERLHCSVTFLRNTLSFQD